MKRAAVLVAFIFCSVRFISAQHGEKPSEGAANHEAAEHKGGEHKSESHEGGEHKNLDPWKWANFAVLAGGLGYLIAKNAGPFFASRSAAIRQGIAHAEKLRAESDAKVADMEKRLANLQSEIDELRAAAAVDEAAQMDRIREQTTADMAKIQAHAAAEIATAGKAARLALKREAARIALGLAEEKVRQRITPQNQDALVQGFVHNLASHAEGTSSGR